MNKKVKERYTAALRSGEYFQGTRWMCQQFSSGERAFCALGVLADLHARETGAEWVPARTNQTASYLGRIGHLPDEVCRWAGLAARDPVVVVADKRRTLSQLNDWGVAFEEIAALVDAQL